MKSVARRKEESDGARWCSGSPAWQQASPICAVSASASTVGAEVRRIVRDLQLEFLIGRHFE
jgi:hypothetical protein